MKTKTTWTIIAAITAGFIVLLTATQANSETTNPIIDTVETVKDKAVNNPVTQFIIKEKNKTVQYQKESWESGKQQLARNKQEISNLWNNITDAVKHYTSTN